MLTNCMNPICRIPFSHARDGRIFTVDRVLTAVPARGAERPEEQYWLCGTCSKSFKVVVEDGRVTTVPIEAEIATLAG
ncbi:MAG: hypothetical protein WCC04_18085 [Terriglobales bacterium]